MKLEMFFKQAHLLRYKKGHLFFRPDDTPTDIFFIDRGFVKSYSITEWGDEKLSIIYKAGEFFPIFWLFDNIPLTKFYEAMDEVLIRDVSKDDLLNLISSDNEALLDLTKRIITIYEIVENRVDSLEFTNAYSRLISRLLYVAKRFGEQEGKKVIIKAPINHKDLAASTAMTRETASREFEKLQKKGVISYSDHTVVINDIHKLKAELSVHFDKKLL
jgi:CRP-like cAMP-binding protein